MPSKKNSEAKARREPNPHLQIEGRIPMQHPARHETMYGTNRSRSASPENDRDWDPPIEAPRAQLRRERDYKNMYREYASGEGEPSRSAQRGRGIQRGHRGQGDPSRPPPPPPHQWMENDDEYEYRGRHGVRGGFGLGFPVKGGYFHGGKQAATKGLERNVEAGNVDEDSQRDVDTMDPGINSQDQQPLGAEAKSETQTPKKLLLAKYEEFLNYACGRFGAEDHAELLIGSVGKSLKSHEKLGDVLLK